METRLGDGLRSILLGTAALWLALGVAVALSFLRQAPRGDSQTRDRLLWLFFSGLAVQCIHLVEEFVTGFYMSWPRFLGLMAWSPEFFVAFNVIWIAIWILSAVVLWRAPHGSRVARWALVPIWFFALGMTLNGVAHPLLALQARGYFPGLVTSPMVGVFGIILWSRLLKFTDMS